MKVSQFLARLGFPGGASPSFGAAQELIKEEPRANRVAELEHFEDDLIKIFGRFLDVILKMNETERQLREIDKSAEALLGQVIVNIPCDPPPSLSLNRRLVPDFYSVKVEMIQALVYCLQLQPAYFVSLAIALTKESERQALLASAKQIYRELTDRQINATFLALCAAVCEAEVERAADVFRLFQPEDSNFIHLFAVYATQSPNLREFGAHLVDPSAPGSAASTVENLKSVILVLDPEKLEELSTKKMKEAELQRAFHRSLGSIRTAVATLGSSLSLPAGVQALLKHAYDCISTHGFSLGASEGPSVNGGGSVNDSIPSGFVKATPFASPLAELNFRTLWIFINSAFEDDFRSYTAGHLLREIFQMCYSRMADLLFTVIANSPDGYIKVELTVGLFLSHFDTEPHIVSVRADILANMINLLKDHEAHLQLSVYDPVAEVLKTMAAGTQGPIFTKDMLRSLEASPYTHNVPVERRFLLREKNLVFDAMTGTPVTSAARSSTTGCRSSEYFAIATKQPQPAANNLLLTTRRSDTAHSTSHDEGRALVSLIHRYIPADPLDPRVTLENALKAVPPVQARTWDALENEMSTLQEFLSRQDPPRFEEAQLASKAAAYAQTQSRQEVESLATLKWIGDGLRRRQRHRAYLLMVQNAEDIVADAQRRYQFNFRKRKDDMLKIIQTVQNLDIETVIRSKMEEQKLVPQFDVVARKRGQDVGVGTTAQPTVTISLRALNRAGVVLAWELSPEAAQTTRVTFTGVESGGWNVQVVESQRTGDKTVDTFELTMDELTRLNFLPPTSVATYGKRYVKKDALLTQLFSTSLPGGVSSTSMRSRSDASGFCFSEQLPSCSSSSGHVSSP